MRKVLVFGMVIGLISLFSFSCFAQGAEVKELSLAKSIEMALENNLDLKQVGYSLELREAEYEEAKANNLLRTSIITLKTSELSLKKARDNFQEKKKQLILEEIPNRYFEVLKVIRKVEIEQISVEQASENLQMVKNKFSLGDANELDVMQAETGFSSAQLSLTQAENDLVVAKINLNYALGLPIDISVKLTDSFSFDSFQIALEESIEKALQDRYEIIQAQDDVELAGLKLSLKQNEYTSEIEQNKAEIELKTKQINLDKIKKQIRIEITTSFLQLNVRKENVEISRKREEEKEENYRISQIQYKAGIITTTELLNSQINLTQAKVNALEAFFAYNLAKNRFIKALGGKLEKNEEKSS